MKTNMYSSRLIGTLILVIALDVCRATAQDKLASINPSGPQLPETAATFRARRDRIMQAAPDALVLVRSRSSIMAENETGFRQNATFYYLNGLENAVGALLVIDSRRHESWLFVPSPGQLPRIGSMMHSPYGYVEPEQAKSLGLDHVVFWDEFAPFIDRRLAQDSSLVIRGPFSNDKTSTTPAVLVGQNEVRIWESVLRARWPNTQFGPMPDAVTLRAIKDTNEAAALRRVAASSSAALRAGLAALRPGRRQREAEVDVVAACVRAGVEGVSFWPWLMTGSNSDIAMAFQSLADRRFLDRTMRAGELACSQVECRTLSDKLKFVERAQPVTETKRQRT